MHVAGDGRRGAGLVRGSRRDPSRRTDYFQFGAGERKFKPPAIFSG